jgi:hypothetical protein
MPPTVAVAAFIFGAILVLVALLGGGFKLFGADIPGPVGKSGRTIAGVLGGVLMVVGLVNPFDRSGTASSSPASPLPTTISSVITAAPQPTVPQVATVAPSPTTEPPSPTQTPVPSTPTATPNPPTPTPQPTAIPLTPTPSDTPSNAVLGMGETWRQNGVELTLVSMEPPTGIDISYQFIFTNNTNQPLAVSYGDSNFTATDQNGIALDVRGFESLKGATRYFCYEFKKVLNPGESIRNKNCGAPLRIAYDTASCRVTEVIITATKVSRIDRAQWKVPLNLC